MAVFHFHLVHVSMFNLYSVYVVKSGRESGRCLILWFQNF